MPILLVASIANDSALSAPAAAYVAGSCAVHVPPALDAATSALPATFSSTDLSPLAGARANVAATGRFTGAPPEFVRAYHVASAGTVAGKLATSSNLSCSV